MLPKENKISEIISNCILSNDTESIKQLILNLEHNIVARDTIAQDILTFAIDNNKTEIIKLLFNLPDITFNVKDEFGNISPTKSNEWKFVEINDTWAIIRIMPHTTIKQ